MNKELYDKYKDATKRNLSLLVSAPRTRPELKEVAKQILEEREAAGSPAVDKPKPATEKAKKTVKPAAEKPKPVTTKKATAKEVTAAPEKAARRPKVDTVKVKLHSKGRKPSGNDPRGSLLTLFKNEDKPKDISFDSISIGDKVEDPKRSYRGTVIRLCYYEKKRTFTFARVQSLTNAQTILLLSTKRLKKIK